MESKLVELRPGKPALTPAVAVPTVAAAGKRGMRLRPYNTRHGLLRQPDPLPQAQAPVRGERLSHALPPVLLDILFRPMGRGEETPPPATFDRTASRGIALAQRRLSMELAEGLFLNPVRHITANAIDFFASLSSIPPCAICFSVVKYKAIPGGAFGPGA